MGEKSQGVSATRIALAALVVAFFSMLGTVGNFLYSVHTRTKLETTGLSLRCEVPPYAKTELLDDHLDLAFNDSGSGFVGGPGAAESPPPGFTAYPRLLTFYAECRVTNVSDRKIAVERLYPTVTFGLATIEDPALMRDVLDQTGKPANFPRLLDQGEQAVYFVQVTWPVLTESLSHLNEVFKGKPAIAYVKLPWPTIGAADDGRGSRGPRRSLAVYVKTGEGKAYSVQLSAPPF